jgi:hypothetical protein
MSRAVCAVDAAPVSGRPVVEQARPSFFAAATYPFSCLAPIGNGTVSNGRSATVCARVDEKHCTFSLKPTPRGSTPTMSNRSSTESLITSGLSSASVVAEPPGPPGLTKRLPMRFFGFRALTRRTATSVVAPYGRS